MVLEIIICVCFVIAIIILVTLIYRSKYQMTVIKIDEAESNLDELLNKKVQLLEKCVPIVKEELKLDEFLTELIGIDNANFNHIQLNDVLKNEYNELFRTLDENEKLFKSDTLNQILRELNDNEEEIIGSIKFYNDNVVVFNKLVASVPAKIATISKHYKAKDFYNNSENEMYEILSE